MHPLTQIFTAAALVAMLVDLVLSLEGYGLGLEEENRLAIWLEPRIGMASAMFLIAGLWCAVIVGLAVTLPLQWTCQAFMLVSWTPTLRRNWQLVQEARNDPIT